MQEKEIIGHELLQLTIKRLCHQLIENHSDFNNTVLIGLQPRGIFLAEKIQSTLSSILGVKVPKGALDITFHRDDFRRRSTPIQASHTDIPFLIEGKKVVLVDDVLFTGRSVRAAMDAMTTFGRPESVELLVLIDRKYTRDLPIHADYVGKTINTLLSEKVIVKLREAEGNSEDSVTLVRKK